MDEQTPRRADPVDRFLAIFEGLPGVRKVRPSTVPSAVALLGRSQTYVVQTYFVDDEDSKSEDRGFFAIVQRVDADGGQRFLLPPKVMAAIYRQREALVAQGRKGRAKARWEGLTPEERAAKVAHLREAK